ncbi:hypothetical protein NIA73_15515 [Anaerobutyricum hallii]|nr:hypothetical protein [Anaerobutyricum hallii]
MYYTIEGKRVLGILYIAGLITGTLFFNITIKMQVFKVSDFLDFTEYMKMLENIDLAIFCSYVVFVRFRQLLLFFVGLFLFSPYIVFCLFDYGVSVFTGILISAMVLKYGWTGLVGGTCFLFPQYFFLWNDFCYSIYLPVSKCSYRKLLYSYFKRTAGDTYITKRQDYHNFTYNRVVFCGMLHRGIYQSIYIKEDFWYFYIGLCSGMENIKIFMYNN